MACELHAAIHMMWLQRGTGCDNEATEGQPRNDVPHPNAPHGPAKKKKSDVRQLRKQNSIFDFDRHPWNSSPGH